MSNLEGVIRPILLIIGLVSIIWGVMELVYYFKGYQARWIELPERVRKPNKARRLWLLETAIVAIVSGVLILLFPDFILDNFIYR